jgi:hypothetical protein
LKKVARQSTQSVAAEAYGTFTTRPDLHIARIAVGSGLRHAGANGHNQSQHPSMGTGLAICRRIVERHGGSLTAKSVQEQGTTFFPVLPQQQLQEALAQNNPSQEASSKEKKM